MVECPKCGGEMGNGGLFVQVTTSSGQTMTGIGAIGMPGMGIPSSQITVDEPMTWREKTGQRTGLIIKSDEVKTMKVRGQRCLSCGYIELYTQS